MKIYIYKRDREIYMSTYYKLLNYVCKQKRISIEKIRNWDDRQESLLSNIFLRSIICNELKIKNNLINFKKNKYNKPYLKDYKNFHFNISHSGKYIVCATNNTPIGIDIEQIKPIDLAVAKYFFTKEEYNDILRNKSFERLQYFYSVWTLKESYIKAIGKGVSIPLSNFTIKILQDKIKSYKTDPNYYFKQYEIDKNYKMSICATKCAWANKVIIKNLEDIRSMLIV